MTVRSNTLTIAELRNRIANIEGGFHFESPLLESDPSLLESDLNEAVNVEVDETESDKAYQKILHFLSYRDRSTYELEQKLKEKDFSENAIHEAISKASRLGLVDDDRFARNFVEHAFRAGKGSRRAVNELSRKGFDDAFAQGVVESSTYAEVDEFDRALEELRRHPPRSKNVRDGAFRRLVGKGYPVSVAAQAARCFTDEAEKSQKAW